MNFFRALSGSGGASKRISRPGDENDAAATTAKLQGYHDLARDALERGYAADTAGERERALQLYEFALKPLREGLSLKVPGALDVSNATQWREEMAAWSVSVQKRIADLRWPGNSSGGNSAPVRPTPITRLRTGSTRVAPPQPSGTSATARAAAPPRQQGHAPRQQGHVRAAGARSSATGAAPASAAPRQQQGAVANTHRESVMGELMEDRGGGGVAWDDVLGLGTAKQALQEAVILPALRSDLFQGLRAPARGLLLYGPPGNGKTLLARALAHESGATFFNISPSSLTSRWHGEGEKLMRALFQVAAERQPSIIFMDEVDALLSARTEGEHDAGRRLKTEFLVQFEGVAKGGDHVIVIGATNRPQELDPAVLRRLAKRIYIPMPDAEGRAAILKHLLSGQRANMRSRDVNTVARATEGYSASDLTALAKEAAILPLRELGDRLRTVDKNSVRPLCLEDFRTALAAIRPSLDPAALAGYAEWTAKYGTGAA